MSTNAPHKGSSNNFIREIIDRDLATGKHGGRVVTRFPPEPNGYPHIGHAKSICLNFGLARDYNGVCHLRMDDTNPTTEDMEYVEAIRRDIRWLGFDWGEHMFYASDYFQRLYDIAVRFVREGKAYVCSLSEEDTRLYRGTVNEAGKPSPYRERSVEENLQLLEGMRLGEFAEGAHTLRAKADMANANMKMRDPLMYRIKKAHHYRSGDAWNIYPMYDFAHCFSDAFEGITHSLCTLEFENNRELYDWFLQQAGVESPPQQIEFARLALDYTVVSKRKLLELVKNGHVSGWDDPRMPTLSALRRRGYTPEAIRNFVEMVGVAKANSNVDIGKLEFAVREDLNLRSPRVLCVLRPLRVVIENWPEEKVEHIDAPYFPKEFDKPESRALPISRTLYIEQDDFTETPPKDWQRLAPGAEVRLRYGYAIKCERVIKEGDRVVELRCSYDPESAQGKTSDGRKVRGIIHWVSAEHALPAEVRLYDRLFSHPRPDEGEAHFTTHLNPHSLETVSGARIEPSAGTAKTGEHFQFERVGFFCVDLESKSGALVFNRAVTLRDSWGAPAAEVVPTPQKKPAAQVGSTPQKKEPAPAARPSAEAETLQKQYDIALDQAERLAQVPAAVVFFTTALRTHADAKAVAPWVVNELLASLKEGPIALVGEQLGELVALVEAQTISRRAGKDVLAKMLSEGGSAAQWVDKLGLRQVSDSGAIEKIVADVLAAQSESVARYRQGESKLFGFLVGQVMSASRGQANPKVVSELVKKALTA
jgi:glutaminyl-tRNA synthetase